VNYSSAKNEENKINTVEFPKFFEVLMENDSLMREIP